jgi:hypothetical protein
MQRQGEVGVKMLNSGAVCYDARVRVFEKSATVMRSSSLHLIDE